MLNSINSNSVVGIYSEVKEIKCEICGKMAMVKAYGISECQECEQDMYGTISGFEVEEYNELKAAHIGKEEVVDADKLIYRLLNGHKYVIRCWSKVHGWQWKAAKMFNDNFRFAREFETREHAEKVAAKYQGQVTTRLMTLSEVMDEGLMVWN